MTPPDDRLLVYHIGRVVVEHDPLSGATTNRYPGDWWSGCAPSADDAKHGAALGIGAGAHRLMHELTHHLVAHARGIAVPDVGGCRIIYRDAHHEPQRALEAQLDEWYITAVQYYALQRSMPDADHYGALIDLARAGVDLPQLARHLRWLLDARAYASGVSLCVVAIPGA